MDFRLILLIAFSALMGSCAEVKNAAEDAADAADNVWKGKRTLTLTFQSHKRYCGGAAPTEEQSRGFTNPIANQVYYLYKDERPSSITKMVKLTTDTEGTFRIDLKTGKYSVIHKDKALSIDEFIKKKKIIDPLYSYGDNACFETWRSTPDFTVELSKSITDTVTISERCFTGDNPCMIYDGPVPP